MIFSVFFIGEVWWKAKSVVRAGREVPKQYTWKNNKVKPFDSFIKNMYFRRKQILVFYQR